MTSIRKVIVSVRDDLLQGHNLDAYLLIVFGLVFSLLDILGVVSLELLGPIILIALTLLVVGDLASRKQNRDFQQTLLAAVTSSSGPLQRFSRADDRMNEWIAAAKSLSLLGLSVSRSVAYYRSPIARMLADGGSLRVLITNPEDEAALKVAAISSEDPGNVSIHLSRITGTIEEIRNFRRLIPNADIQLRVLDMVPPFTMTLIELNEQESSKFWCHVRLPGFRKSVSDSPVIAPDPKLHEWFFEFYRAQFEELWSIAKPYSSAAASGIDSPGSSQDVLQSKAI